MTMFYQGNLVQNISRLQCLPFMVVTWLTDWKSCAVNEM